jgi:uncharacterized protein (DUF1015 family)
MSLIKPFRGLGPTPGRAAEVAAPPYDVVTAAEARALVAERPWSFLHVSRAEVDLPAATDPYDPRVYATARDNLERMVSQGVLEVDTAPSLYVYRLTMGGHVQTGLVAAASVTAYDNGRIKKHELTRPAKEDDRVRQIDALNAQTGPVFLVYPSNEPIDAILSGVAAAPPRLEVTVGGVLHQLWRIADAELITTLVRAFDAVPALYVADGHHRSAAASRVAALRRAANPGHTGREPYNYFLSVVFPADQVQILDYNRVVRDLNGLSVDGFLARVRERFDLQAREAPVRPVCHGEFGMYLDGRWYHLQLDPRRIPTEDPVASLDVSLLSDHLIEPCLGIADQRRDERIDFVGGIRGLETLQARVDSGEMAVAFSLYPTTMHALMRVADRGEVMPPKSTWFEPKLADGLVSHLLD